MITALLLSAQVVVHTLLPPFNESLPATTWSCDFNGTDASAFSLSGTFAEVPVGTNRYVWLPTTIHGNPPDVLNQQPTFQAIHSYANIRTYQVSVKSSKAAGYNIILNLMAGDALGVATITHYILDNNNFHAKIYAFATGSCRATFHPVGYLGTGQ